MKSDKNELTGEERELIETLLKHPSLETAYDQTSSAGFARVKTKMQTTVANLERVVRRGSQADAARAAKIIEAYRTTINFLDELEQTSKTQTK